MRRRSPQVWLLSAMLFAYAAAPAPGGPDGVFSGSHTIAIQPTSASLAGGKARLTMGSLQRRAGKYIGDYQIKVLPYFFKNETGTLSITASDESLRNLAGGTVINCSGKAVTDGTGKTRSIKVKAVPAAAGASRGKLTISIPTENGELVFATDYTVSGR